MLSPETNWGVAIGGGALIGLAATILFLVLDRKTGISGISSYLISPRTGYGWRFCFVAGLLLAGLALSLSDVNWFGVAQKQEVSVSTILIAGLFVGFGTQLGTGCTSGHGICGLPRISTRSILAVCSFLSTAALTASLVHCEPSLFKAAHTDGSNSLYAMRYPTIIQPLVGVAVLILTGLGARDVLGDASLQSKSPWTWVIVSWLGGFIFGCGLMVSRMVDHHRVLEFLILPPIWQTYPKVGLSDSSRCLEISTGWNPSLMGVMIAGVVIHFIANLIAKYKLDRDVFFPEGKITFQLGFGSVLFGIGWGLAGICPGPALVGLASGRLSYVCFVAAMFIGYFSHNSFFPSATPSTA